MNKYKEKFFGFSLIIQAAILIVCLVLFFGIIGPSMISSNSTAAVWFGIFMLGFVSYAVWELSLKLREIIKNV